MAFSAGPPAGARRIGTSLAEINIIPLVDVVLVLLLIFMLTAPMMYRGIDVNLPRAAARPTAVEERMVLTVTKDRALYLNDKRVPSGGLEGMLRDAFRNRKDKTLYLKADAGLSYGAVIETMDMVRRAGIERLGMVTERVRARDGGARDAGALARAAGAARSRLRATALRDAARGGQGAAVDGEPIAAARARPRARAERDGGARDRTTSHRATRRLATGRGRDDAQRLGLSVRVVCQDRARQDHRAMGRPGYPRATAGGRLRYRP